MATQFSDLQKLLINVKFDKCDAFINAHINDTWPITETEDNPRPSTLPEFNYDETDTYYNKVVFLQKYNTIYTKGTFFGYNGDLKESFDDLFNGLTKGISANGITVKYNPDATDGPAIETTVIAATYDKDSDSWDKQSNVVTGSTVKEYVDAKVAGAVAEAAAAMEFKGEINEDTLTEIHTNAQNGDVYVVGTGFEANGQKFESGDLVIFRKDDEDAAATYIVVERNLDDAIVTGTAFNDGQLVVAEGTGKVKTTGYTIGGDTFAATGTYVLATEAAVSTAISSAIDAIDHSNGSGNGTYMTYTYHTTNGITYIDSVAPKLADYYWHSGYEIPQKTQDGLVNSTTLDTIIDYCYSKFTSIDHSVTTLTPVADSDYLSITEDNGNGSDNDYNYTIGLNVVRLSDAVGMTYDETTGKWSAPEGSSVEDGLASAADVANELVSDEKVIAAALNDHEARIDALEDFVGDINGTIQDQLVIGDVTVKGLTATVAEEGLVNATLLARVINDLDPWEDYE